MFDHPVMGYIEQERKTAPRYVRLQMERFERIALGDDPVYCIDTEKVQKIDGILKKLKMPSGVAVGKPFYDILDGYQWLCILGALAIVRRDDKMTRKTEIMLLEIGRKNGKTLIIALLFILLFLLEPQFSQFFSVAPDGALSRLVMEEIKRIIAYNERVFTLKGKAAFKLMQNEIRFLPKSSVYKPLNYARGRFDGRLPSVWLADEVGALPDNSAIESMKSGQLTVPNKLGFLISTKYDRIDNPMEQEIKYAKDVLDGVKKDEHLFALLYEPDDPKEWETNDKVLADANPLAKNIPMVWDELLTKRKKAIDSPGLRTNFLLKHCNILYTGIDTESFVDIGRLQECKIDAIDWNGRTVWVGVDMAMSNDNCSVMYCTEEDGCVYIGGKVFLPEGRMDEKSRAERVDYRRYCEDGHAIACGDRTVSYAVIEEYVLKLEETLGVNVAAIGFDRYNCLSSAGKWEAGGYNTVDVKQHSSVLHPATKLLSELIEDNKLHYAENPLLEQNFANARCQYDTNLNRYVSKKRSRGKVDMVAALLNAVYLMQQDIYIGDGLDWGAILI